MSHLLLLLSIDTPTVKCILSCDDGAQWIALIGWLNSQNIGLCQQNEYKNPDSLKPRNTYCVKSDDINDAYTLFQVLQTVEWDNKDVPPPQFVRNIGHLTWIYTGARNRTITEPDDGIDSFTPADVM